MFRIVGTDGKVYGPVSVEQIRTWITEGRIGADTRAQREGAADWQPLSAFPEFADAFFATPGVPPSAGPTDPDAMAAQVIARAYKPQIGESIGRAWQVVKKELWFFVGATALLWVLTAVTGAIPYAGFILGYIFDPVWIAGYMWICAKRMRGEEAKVGDLFAGFQRRWGQLILQYLVSSILIGIGLILCIAPGVYLGVSFMFGMILVMDKQMDFWPAMKLSFKVVNKQWWSVFLLALVAGLLGMAGIIACCVGALVTAPIAACAMNDCYNRMFCPELVPADKPAAA